MKFQAHQFTATEWSSAEDKAKFANHFVRFVEGDFKDTLFPQWFYNRLSMCFGHIAHYNRGGFYAEWFHSLRGRFRFVEHKLQYPCYGQPNHTWSDVERVLQDWLRLAKILPRQNRLLTEAIETAERAELVRLSAKFSKTSLIAKQHKKHAA